jgi:hypothetical protein
VPPNILGCYSAMLPRLEASERMDRISDMLAAEGRMLEDHVRQRYMAQLERQVQGHRRPRRATVQDLRTMHVQVVVEEPAGEPERKGGE